MIRCENITDKTLSDLSEGLKMLTSLKKVQLDFSS